MDGVRGWEGGSVLGTIGLGPRPHALGFAKKCECRLRKALVFAIKNTILRQGETPMDPPKKLIFLFLYRKVLIENPKVFLDFIFCSATAILALDPEALEPRSWCSKTVLNGMSLGPQAWPWPGQA